tara:strand:- start:44 stop:808 length:765 start_codon:yes stop_codon:yes gene_type:complete
MKFDLSNIERSNSDIKRGVMLPKKLTKELSEFIGIMVGDGHLGRNVGRSKSGCKFTRSNILISGNKLEELYLKNVMDLFHRLFNLNMSYVQDTSPNAVIIRAQSKGILEFLNKICEIPLNRKTNSVKIPDIIKVASKSIKYAFLRGLADTDFSVTFKNRTNKGHNYPVIKASFKSENLVKDLENLYLELGFKYCVIYNERGYDKRFNRYDYINSIYLNGKLNFSKWFNRIGFSNSKFQRKVVKWKKDGICPPGY